MKLNKEEKEIISAYEKSLIKTTAPSKKELNEVKSIPETTFRKKCRLTLIRPPAVKRKNYPITKNFPFFSFERLTSLYACWQPF